MVKLKRKSDSPYIYNLETLRLPFKEIKDFNNRFNEAARGIAKDKVKRDELIELRRESNELIGTIM